MSVHYFLCRQGDSFYRIGAEDTIKEHDIAQDYLSQYYDSVEFIDDFADTIYSDIDKDTGKGTRKYPGGTLVTCKYLFQLRTTKKNNDYFAYLRRYHDGLKVVVEQEYRRRNKGAVA